MKITHVLLVEDHVALQVGISDMIKLTLGHHVKVSVAGTVPEADILFEKHQEDINIILLDTSLGRGVTTFELTKCIRKRFNGLMLAISTDEDHRKVMVDDCGCDDECDKGNLFEYIERLKAGRLQLERVRVG